MTDRPNLLGPDVRANPYPLYAQLRRERPLCQVDPGGFWAVSRYRDIQFVLSNPQVFSSQGLRALLLPPRIESNPLADSLLALDPPTHTRLRGLVSHAFGPRAMARLEPQIRNVAGELAGRLCALGRADFMSEFAGPLSARVIAEVLGLDPALHVHFKRWTDAISAISPAITDPARIAEILGTVRETDGYLRQVIRARRDRPRDDMISDLLRPGARGDVMTDEELLAFLFVILPAGLETSMYFLSSALRVLFERPDVVGRLRAERAHVPMFLEEVLRYDSPGHGTLRVTTRAAELAGAAVPPGAVILLLMASSNRDEQKFKDADRFDMDRPSEKSLAFGYDVHFCLGAPLARLEARVALEELIARCERFVALSDELEWNQSLTVRGPVRLPAEFTPRAS
ncbi:MAG TPA: cytochrome P450 [Polyangiaceae bacterium]|nr:cytochrome P450 [Polyangiaceae bacterium]